MVVVTVIVFMLLCCALKLVVVVYASFNFVCHINYVQLQESPQNFIEVKKTEMVSIGEPIVTRE